MNKNNRRPLRSLSPSALSVVSGGNLYAFPPIGTIIGIPVVGPIIAVPKLTVYP